MTTPAYWTQATREIAADDDFLAGIIARHKALTVGIRGDAFQTLARAIVGQQISVKAAQSVWERFAAEVGEVEPGHVAGARLEALRAAGLSARKVEYIQDLAGHFRSGELDPSVLPALPDEQLIERLVRVRGIGRWTAQMFLIFHLGRPDVFPVGDLGLQRAVSLHYRRGRPVTERAVHLLGRRWAPWRSVATWYLWRSLEPVPVEY